MNTKREDYVAHGIPKVTYRGWPGHYILGDRCLFRLNTLIELFEWKVVVSTVGNVMNAIPCTSLEMIDSAHYFETRAFWAKCDKSEGRKYWESDVTREICLSLNNYVSEQDDRIAQANHEKAVDEIRHKLIQRQLEYPK